MTIFIKFRASGKESRIFGSDFRGSERARCFVRWFRARTCTCCWRTIYWTWLTPWTAACFTLSPSRASACGVLAATMAGWLFLLFFTCTPLRGFLINRARVYPWLVCSPVAHLGSGRMCKRICCWFRKSKEMTFRGFKTPQQPYASLWVSVCATEVYSHPLKHACWCFPDAQPETGAVHRPRGANSPNQLGTMWCREAELMHTHKV